MTVNKKPFFFFVKRGFAMIYCAAIRWHSSLASTVHCIQKIQQYVDIVNNLNRES